VTLDQTTIPILGCCHFVNRVHLSIRPFPTTVTRFTRFKVYLYRRSCFLAYISSRCYVFSSRLDSFSSPSPFSLATFCSHETTFRSSAIQSHDIDVKRSSLVVPNVSFLSSIYTLDRSSTRIHGFLGYSTQSSRSTTTCTRSRITTKSSATTHSAIFDPPRILVVAAHSVTPYLLCVPVAATHSHRYRAIARVKTPLPASLSTPACKMPLDD
jgi:hypothetical protein